MSRPFETSTCEVVIRRKAYRSAVGDTIEVVRDLAFTLPAGTATAIVGPSGCGKTTTLNILLGLDRDFQGEVRGAPQRIGAVFQEPRLLPWRTAAENIALAERSMRSEPIKPELLRLLGIEEVLDRYPAELSLGLARRVALARALVIAPDLLVLDEPFVSLDEVTAERLRRLIGDVIATHSVTTVLVTHDLDEAARLADRVVVLTPRPATLHQIIDLPPRPDRDAAAVSLLRSSIDLSLV